MRRMLALGAALAMLGSMAAATMAAPASAMTQEHRQEVLALAGKAKVDLCEYKECDGTPSASEFAEAYAEELWGGTAHTEACEGPFENARGKTQWACYGHDSKGFYWQINVSAYGELTYYNKE